MNVVSGQKQTISGVSMERSPLNFINLANPRLLYIFKALRKPCTTATSSLPVLY